LRKKKGRADLQHPEKREQIAQRLLWKKKKSDMRRAEWRGRGNLMQKE